MDDDKVYVPYIVYEGEMTRQERQTKRLIVMLIIMLALFFASNMAWLYVWNQYEYVDSTESTSTTTIKATQDGESVNIVGGEDVTYGSDSRNNEKETKITDQEEKER